MNRNWRSKARSRFTLIVLVTPEEERALTVVKVVCDRAQEHPCLTWDVVDGFQFLANWRGSLPSAKDPMTALEQVNKVTACLSSRIF